MVCGSVKAARKKQRERELIASGQASLKLEIAEGTGEIAERTGEIAERTGKRKKKNVCGSKKVARKRQRLRELLPEERARTDDDGSIAAAAGGESEHQGSNIHGVDVNRSMALFNDDIGKRTIPFPRPIPSCALRHTNPALPLVPSTTTRPLDHPSLVMIPAAARVSAEQHSFHHNARERAQTEEQQPHSTTTMATATRNTAVKKPRKKRKRNEVLIEHQMEPQQEDEIGEQEYGEVQGDVGQEKEEDHHPDCAGVQVAENEDVTTTTPRASGSYHERMYMKRLRYTPDRITRLDKVKIPPRTTPTHSEEDDEFEQSDYTNGSSELDEASELERKRNRRKRRKLVELSASSGQPPIWVPHDRVHLHELEQRLVLEKSIERGQQLEEHMESEGDADHDDYRLLYQRRTARQRAILGSSREKRRELRDRRMQELMAQDHYDYSTTSEGEEDSEIGFDRDQDEYGYDDDDDDEADRNFSRRKRRGSRRVDDSPQTHRPSDPRYDPRRSKNSSGLLRQVHEERLKKYESTAGTRKNESNVTSSTTNTKTKTRVMSRGYRGKGGQRRRKESREDDGTGYLSDDLETAEYAPPPGSPASSCTTWSRP